MDLCVPLQKALEGTGLSPSAAQPSQGTQRPGKGACHPEPGGMELPQGWQQEEPHGSENETILTFAPNPQHALVSKPLCRGTALKGPMSARPHCGRQASSPSWSSTVLRDRDGHLSPPPPQSRWSHHQLLQLTYTVRLCSTPQLGNSKSQAFSVVENPQTPPGPVPSDATRAEAGCAGFSDPMGPISRALAILEAKMGSGDKPADSSQAIQQLTLKPR